MTPALSHTHETNVIPVEIMEEPFQSEYDFGTWPIVEKNSPHNIFPS